LCERYGVPLVEDAAEALGASFGNRAAGAFGACAAFSFNGNKIITSSGGGMLVSTSRELVERARHLATQARDEAPHYEHSEVGFNYRLSNLLAALGRAQLTSLTSKVARRRAIRGVYQNALSRCPGIEFLTEANYGRSNAWLSCITVDTAVFGASREDVRSYLHLEGIESRPVWKPMHLQPAFRHCRVRHGAVAGHLFETGLCLPSGSGMSAADQARVIAAIEHVPQVVCKGSSVAERVARV
jgi:pyridoxal phosphate-dependent aminotransferase EpsN